MEFERLLSIAMGVFLPVELMTKLYDYGRWLRVIASQHCKATVIAFGRWLSVVMAVRLPAAAKTSTYACGTPNPVSVSISHVILRTEYAVLPIVPMGISLPVAVKTRPCVSGR